MPSIPDDLIGQVVAGRYRILDRLGAGGMGTVYLAVHEAIEKKVALKVLRPDYSDKPDLVQRFQQEAISASRIKHPNVLDVFDFGALDNGCFYLAMEFLEGHDLADELERAHWLVPEQALRVGLQICKALAAAHGKGVVHRDMKPENVFLQLTADGEEIVKIVDFGIAQLRSNEDVAKSEPQRRRLTRTGMIFGTPEYMSPEQGAGKHMDLRVDIYATGVILYEMLTGAVPFTGDTFFGVINAHMNQPLTALRVANPEVSVSAELETVVTRALAKDPDHRFQSMRELANALMSTPEGIALDPTARRSAVPSVTLAEFHHAAAESARLAGQPPEPIPPATNAVLNAPATNAVLNAPAANAAPVAGAVTLEQAATVLISGATVPSAEKVLRAEKASRAWVLAVLGVLLVGGALAVGLRFMPRREQPPAASSETPAPLPSGVATVPTVAAVTPTIGPDPAKGLRITVTTDPEGALLLKGGFQVCDKTPCEVMAQPNESIELEAKKDKLRGTAKVLAQKEQSVHIKLEAKPSAAAAPPASVEMVPCLVEETTPEGLKVVKQSMCPKSKPKRR